MFGLFDIYGNMVDEKRRLKRFMIKNHITFLKLRNLFFLIYRKIIEKK